MRVVGRDPAVRQTEEPPVVERVAEVRATAEKLRLQARDIRAETRRVVAAARRTRFHLVTQGERFRAVQAVIRLRRLRRAWGE